jgi:hypothetical protein
MGSASVFADLNRFPPLSLQVGVDLELCSEDHPCDCRLLSQGALRSLLLGRAEQAFENSDTLLGFKSFVHEARS